MPLITDKVLIDVGRTAATRSLVPDDTVGTIFRQRAEVFKSMHDALMEFLRFIAVDFPQDLIVLECDFVCKNWF